MQDVLRTLRELQEVDKDLYRVREELRRLPAERAKRRAELDQRIARRTEIETKQRDLRARVKEIEHAGVGGRQRLRKLDNEAATSRQDAALLAAFQHEIRTLKRELSDLEDEGLRLLSEVDGLEQERSTLDEQIGKDEQVYAEFDANVQRELDAGRTREGELSAERKKRMSGGVQPDVLLRYEQILETRDGSALAELDGRVCQGCFINVPPNTYVRIARGLELVQCPSCDRILYLRG